MNTEFNNLYKKILENIHREYWYSSDNGLQVVTSSHEQLVIKYLLTKYNLTEYDLSNIIESLFFLQRVKFKDKTFNFDKFVLQIKHYNFKLKDSQIKELCEKLNKLSEDEIKTILHLIDARNYALEQLNWIRIRNNDIQVNKLTPDILNDIVNAIEQINSLEHNNVEEELINIEVMHPYNFYTDVPLSKLREGNIRSYGMR